MSTHHERRWRKPLLLIGTLLFSSLVFLYLFSQTTVTQTGWPIIRSAKKILLPNVSDVSIEEPDKGFDAIYIMGGTEKSLILKFKTVYDLCQRNGCKAILMLSRPGVTEYSEAVGRNLSNDEWALIQMKKIGLPNEMVEFVKMGEGFFGTYNEAKHIARLLDKSAYTSIAVVSSGYHTKRVRGSFEHFLARQSVTQYYYGSAEKGSLYDLVVEFFKLKLYQLLLI